MSLLNDASLVLIPSGYKEDKVYSIIPSDGSGDLDFVRGSDGTRINSLGQVENVCWNLIKYSNTFNNGNWVTGGYGNLPTLSANVIANPINGNVDAWSANFNSTGTQGRLLQLFTGLQIDVPYTFSMYVKANSKTELTIYRETAGFGYYAIYNLTSGTVIGTAGSTATITNLANGWHFVTITGNTVYTSNAQFGIITAGVDDGSMYIYGAQLNVGSTAKPYFPTTDRLNVPRLTYENGCPSLLLEKQSTNLVIWSEDFGNGWWSKDTTTTLTLNDGISPDGTQNADRFQSPSSSKGLYSYGASGLQTISIYIKAGNISNIGKQVQFFTNTATQNFTLTDNWQRISVSGSSSNLIALYPTSSNGFNNILIWGAQGEASSYPTSYIPTTSTSVTRLADSCYKTGISSLIGQTSGTMFVEISNKSQRDGARYMFLSDTTFTNRIVIYHGSNVLNVYCSAGGTFNLIYNLPSGKAKIAFAYQSGNYSLFVNGVERATSTESSVPANLSATGFSSNEGNIGQPEPMDTSINQALLFQRRLTDTELAQLTTL
jgi:hypothetical protein